MRSSFSVGSAPWRLRPHTLQAAKKSPPRRAAPPTPTQTPITAFLVEEDIPLDFLVLESLARAALAVGFEESDVELALLEA